MIEREPPLHDAADREVDRAWREMSQEEPSAAVDEAIRAAASRERTSKAGREPGPPPARIGRSTPGWLPLAAAAGVAAIAFGLVRLQPPEPAAPTIEQSSTAPRPAAAAPSEADRQDRDAGITGETRDRVDAAQPQASMSSATPAAPAVEPARRPGAREAPLQPPEAPASPDDWIRRIQSLLEQGDQDAAAAALRSFRTAHPGADALLPAELRAWASGVGPD
jgi:hypothetical protein